MTVMFDIQETLEDHARRGVFVEEVRLSDERWHALVGELRDVCTVVDPWGSKGSRECRVVGPFGFCRVASVLHEWPK